MELTSLKDVFALSRYAGTDAALIRCTHVEEGHNQKWLAQNKTGIWACDRTKRNPQTIIVLIDSIEIKRRVEVWAGRSTGKWSPYQPNAKKGFFHVDYFERVGFTQRRGLQKFCAPYCPGPQVGPVYIRSSGNEGASADTAHLMSKHDIEDDFSPEFSGEKEGGLPGRYTANCVHGRVVTALHDLVKQETPNCKTTNRRFYDLLVEDIDASRILFEVKTSDSTQSVYTAVGQLTMYNLKAKAHKRILVLPHLGNHWRIKLNELQIDLWTYEMKDESILFHRPA